jgi:hypothetical protein
MTPNNRTRRDQSNQHTFFFTLQVYDETMALPVILYGKEAEKFLQIDAKSFYENEKIQKEIQEKLQNFGLETKNLLDFYVHSYVIDVNQKDHDNNNNNATSSKPKRK